MTKSWVVFGDSHARSFAKVKPDRARRPVVGGTIAGARFFMGDFFEVDGDGFRFRGKGVQQSAFEMYLKVGGFRSLDEARGRLIVSLGLAGMPFCGSLARSSAVFDSDVASSNQHHVSRGAMEAIRDYAVQDTVRFYRYCLERRFFAAALAPPPPQREHLAVKAYGVRIFELLAFFEAPVRSLLAEYNCPLIGVPPETVDNEGFLLPFYTGKNVGHANRAYGSLAMTPFLQQHSHQR